MAKTYEVTLRITLPDTPDHGYKLTPDQWRWRSVLGLAEGESVEMVRCRFVNDSEYDLDWSDYEDLPF